MIQFSSQALDLAIASILWPFIRILALVATAPVLGHRTVPVRVKVGLSLLVALLVAPTLSVPASPLASPAGIILLVQQILIGISMGFTLRIMIAAVELAGELIGLQMGLNFAGFFDPATSSQGTPVGAWLSMLVTLIFLAMNGHLMVLFGVVESFRVMPITPDAMAVGDWKRMATLGTELFRVGMYVALPILAAMLVCNIGMGVLARVAPQLNIFAVGFSITLLVGYFVLTLSMPSVGQYIESSLGRGLEMMIRR